MLRVIQLQSRDENPQWSGCCLRFATLLSPSQCSWNWFPGHDAYSMCSMKFSRNEWHFLILFFLHEARKCFQERNRTNAREKQDSPILFCHFLISRIQIEFQTRLPEKAGDLALTLTLTMTLVFCVQTGGGSKNRPCLYNLTYLLDNSLSEQHPSEAPNPNISQTPKSGRQLLLKDEFGPEIIHTAPSSSFSSKGLCTEFLPSPHLSATRLFQERFITGLSTQSYLYGKR